MMRWGLMPPWAKDLSESSRRINARAETAATAHAFRDAMRHRRCLVLADGFYEWRGERDLRVPFYLRPVPTRLVTFAGLWERWKSPAGDWLLSSTILTGPANHLIDFTAARRGWHRLAASTDARTGIPLCQSPLRQLTPGYL
jgi:putative SOS response-associated peptidase YedK